MNNTDFRRFVLDTPRRSEDAASSSPSGFAKPGAPASSLGSRSKSSIPMTPRTVKGSSSVDFARQLAEQNAASQPAKKFRSSAAPKGAKLSEGYTDRTLQRTAAQEEANDEREARIQALEEQMKLGQIDRDTFEKLRDSITGGDVSTTHLVKGLDRRLLARVRKGEDVLSGQTGNKDKEAKDDEKSPEANADDEFEQLEQKELASIAREKAEKKGELAPAPTPVAGTKRSRNDILAELKASRKAAAEAKAAAQPQLGARFKRFGQQSSIEPRIETDEKGREVLITVDENGRVKRKVRKVSSTAESAVSKGLLVPDKSAKPLGMEVPELSGPARKATVAEPESDDIFEGVDDSFDPLSALAAEANEEDTSSSSEDEDEEIEDRNQDGDIRTDSLAGENRPTSHSGTLDSNPAKEAIPQKNNYFNDKIADDEAEAASKGLNDPAILEMIKRAAALRPQEEAKEPTGNSPGSPDALSSSAAAKRLLQRDRDLDDIDMGFGSSRFDDEDEDGDGSARVKLSEWKGGLGDEDEDGEGGEKGRGGKQRKRGKKKRKGDKDSAADVLKVMEGRKK